MNEPKLLSEDTVQSASDIIKDGNVEIVALKAELKAEKKARERAEVDLYKLQHNMRVSMKR